MDFGYQYEQTNYKRHLQKNWGNLNKIGCLTLLKGFTLIFFSDDNGTVVTKKSLSFNMNRIMMSRICSKKNVGEHW